MPSRARIIHDPARPSRQRWIITRIRHARPRLWRYDSGPSGWRARPPRSLKQQLRNWARTKKKVQPRPVGRRAVRGTARDLGIRNRRDAPVQGRVRARPVHAGRARRRPLPSGWRRRHHLPSRATSRRVPRRTPWRTNSLPPATRNWGLGADTSSSHVRNPSARRQRLFSRSLRVARQRIAGVWQASRLIRSDLAIPRGRLFFGGDLGGAPRRPRKRARPI